MARLRIAQVAERGIGTGASEAAAALSAVLAKNGHAIRLFRADPRALAATTEVSPADGEFFADWFDLHQQVNRINSGRQAATLRDQQVIDYHAGRWEAHDRLVDALGEFDADIVHFHNVSAVLPHTSALDISRRWPLVWTLHDRFPFDLFHNEWWVGTELVRSWGKTIAGRESYFGRDLLAASAVPIDFVAPSQWLADLTSASPFGRSHRVHVVRNVVSEAAPAGVISVSRLREALEADRLLLAVVPRPDYSLKALDILKEAFFRARALLSHSRETKERRIGLLVATTEDLGLASWGLFTLADLARLRLIDGNRYLTQGEMRDLYRSVDAVVISSRVENMPNVMVEAIRDGCPVIATAVGGIGEVLSRTHGRLIQPESIAEMADAIIDVAVLSDREAYEDELRALWVKHFDQGKITAEIEVLYERAISLHPCSRSRN